LGGLTALDLSANDIGDEEMRALAASSSLNSLTALYLVDSWVGDAGARAVADSPHLAGLTRLDLSGNQIGDAGAEALASSPHLGRLTHLDLSNNWIGAAGARAVVHSTRLAGLTELDLSFNQVSREVVQALSAVCGPSGRRLDFYGDWGDGAPTGQQQPRPDRRGLSSADFAAAQLGSRLRNPGLPTPLTGPERWSWPWH
jgi:Ran GTPase-activating protein (RanGAP) involved in mRNA processing and transport